VPELRGAIRSLSGLLARSAERHPERDAVVMDGTHVTWAGLAARSRRIARSLAARGVARGDRVGLWLPKSQAAVAALWGTLECGAAYVPIDPGAPVARLAALARDAGLRALVTIPDRAAAAAEALAGLESLRAIWVTGPLAAGTAGTIPFVTWAEVESESDAAAGDPAGSGDPSASIEEILDEVEAWQSCQITLPRVRVVFDPHPPLPMARIRPDHLRDALAAIVTNAKEAMAGTLAGEVHVAAEANSKWITITVMDEGPGINVTTLARLFEPYNSTKTRGSHLGLGLSVARELLMRAGGDLGISTSEAQPRTCIRMRIPIRPRDASAGPDLPLSGAHDPALPTTRTDTPGPRERISAAA